MDDKELLLKKWELYWNHYKLQNEITEKRRNFLWIIEAAIFYGWYQTYNNIFLISLLFNILGFLLTIVWIIVMKRDSESIFLTEQGLRDIEGQFNKKSPEIKLEKFLLDKQCLALISPDNMHKWEFIDESYGENTLKSLWSYEKSVIIRIIYDKVNMVISLFNIKSIRSWLTWVLPFILICTWICIFISMIINIL